MKLIPLIVIATIIFTACNKVQNEANTIVEDGKKSINNVVDEVKTTKAKLDETVKDVEEAVNEIKEAKKAIKEITE